jgi:hypothetical protein
MNLVFHKESSLLFDKLSDYQLFKEYPAPWSLLELIIFYTTVLSFVQGIVLIMLYNNCIATELKYEKENPHLPSFCQRVSRSITESSWLYARRNSALDLRVFVKFYSDCL